MYFKVYSHRIMHRRNFWG